MIFSYYSLGMAMAAVNLNDMACSSGMSSSVKSVAADARMKPMAELRSLFTLLAVREYLFMGFLTVFLDGRIKNKRKKDAQTVAQKYCQILPCLEHLGCKTGWRWIDGRRAG